MTTLKRTRDLAARAAVAARTEALLRAAGAVPDADGREAGGRAAPDVGALLEDPVATSEVCGYLAAEVRGAGERAVVDVVVAASRGADVLAFETARQLGVRALPAGRPVSAGARVLLVDDAWAGSDSALQAALAALEADGADVRACGTVLDLTAGSAHVASAATGRRYPLLALWRPA